MIHLGLIGYPLGHSLSPKIHTAALKACGLEGDYALFPIAPDDKEGLKDLLGRVRSGEITGLNVTIPHKQNVIPLLDELTDTAKSIGAVNTIYLLDNKLIGENTDAPGFLSDLNSFLAESPSTGLREGLGVREKSALVLGAGGSARAVTYSLLKDKWSVTIAARRVEQAKEFATSYPNNRLRITSFSDLQPSTPRQAQDSAFDLVVNTTPLGMSPNLNQSALPENLSLPQHVAIYDLVYNPSVTKLVRDARLQGLQATTGLGMLIEQAALSFEIWTGCNPPRKAISASVEQSPVSNL